MENSTEDNKNDFTENIELPDLPGEKAKRLKQTDPEMYKIAQYIYADVMGIISAPDATHLD